VPIPDVPDLEAEQYIPGSGSAFLRLLGATVVTGFVALLSALAWLIGQAQYINDYCTTRAPQPITTPPEALGGRPAYMDDPITVACEYDGFPTVYVTEPGPLFGALLMMAIVIAVAFGAYRWARPSAR
jgi:amino acid transporter